MNETLPDFHGFLVQQAQRLYDDFCAVESESQLEDVRRKWLGPPNGILENLKGDHFYVAATKDEREFFDDYIRERIGLETTYFKRFLDLWSP